MFFLLLSAVLHHLFIFLVLKIDNNIEMIGALQHACSLVSKIYWNGYIFTIVLLMSVFIFNTILLCTKSLPGFLEFSCLVLKYCISLQTLYLLELKHAYLSHQHFFCSLFLLLGCRYDGSKWNDTFNVGSLQNT